MNEYYDVILEDVEGGIRPRKNRKLPEKKQPGNPWQFASVAGQIGFDVALPMVIGLFVGIKIDERLGSRPTATLILLCVGILMGCASLIRIVRDTTNKR